MKDLLWEALQRDIEAQTPTEVIFPELPEMNYRFEEESDEDDSDEMDSDYEAEDSDEMDSDYEAEDSDEDDSDEDNK